MRTEEVETYLERVAHEVEWPAAVPLDDVRRGRRALRRRRTAVGLAAVCLLAAGVGAAATVPGLDRSAPVAPTGPVVTDPVETGLPSGSTVRQIVLDHLDDVEVVTEPTDAEPSMTVRWAGVELTVRATLVGDCPVESPTFDECEQGSRDGHRVYTTVVDSPVQGENRIELHGDRVVTQLVARPLPGTEVWSAKGLGDLLADPRWQE